jgi:hypothetical protein
MLLNEKISVCASSSNVCAAAVLWNKLDTSFLQRGHQSSPRFRTTPTGPSSASSLAIVGSEIPEAVAKSL